MVWGTYLEKNCPSSNGHILVFGGVYTLAQMVWGTYRFRKHTTPKNGPKKSAPMCPVECGGGPIAIWAMPKWRGRQRIRVFPYQAISYQVILYL